MAKQSFDTLRAMAIASQAVGLVTIITLETIMRDAARPWQGAVLLAMVATALAIAMARLYRRNKARKQRDAHLQETDDTGP